MNELFKQCCLGRSLQVHHYLSAAQTTVFFQNFQIMTSPDQVVLSQVNEMAFSVCVHVCIVLIQLELFKFPVTMKCLLCDCLLKFELYKLCCFKRIKIHLILFSLNIKTIKKTPSGLKFKQNL